MSEVGTTKLHAVPLGQLRTLVPAPIIEGLTFDRCAGRAFAGRGGPEAGVRTLLHEPNLRLQGLLAVAHRLAMTVQLERTACSHHTLELVLRPPSHEHATGFDAKDGSLVVPHIQIPSNGPKDKVASITDNLALVVPTVSGAEDVLSLLPS